MALKPKLEVVESNDLPGMPVVSALLHQACPMPGTQGTEKSLNQTKLPGVRMSFDGANLWIEYKGKRGFIPSANVACGHLK